MPNDEHNEIIEFIESSLALHEADKDNEEFINQDKQISGR
tara:strand:- start:223 stop:342 length:120 start_codon:yes stop_codon:yes gene_type:complete